jgi:hypothetical protein
VAIEQIAAQHARQQVALARRASAELVQLWRQVDQGYISGSWASLLPRALVAVGRAQMAAAADIDSYVDNILEAQGVSADAAGSLQIGSLAGIASDGRPLVSLLQQPVITALQSLGSGQSPARALALGSVHLDMIAQTQIADAGRAATSVAIAARPKATGYVRVASAGACSRCLVLAGRHYAWNKGFLRHPRCHCKNVPAAGGDFPEGMQTSPRKAFDALSTAEQDRVFTRAGAEAIRAGADIGQVVNARRGMQVVDRRGRKVQVTTEGTTRRGLAGRRLGPKNARLMPEQILRDATSREDAIRLLQAHGYLTARPLTFAVPGPARPSVIIKPRAAPKPAVPVLTYEERLASAAKEHEALASPRFGLDRRPRPDEFTPEMAKAIKIYTGPEYDAINRQLRGLPLPYGYEAADVLPWIGDMDKAFAVSHVDRDVLVHRGVLDATTMFGDRLAGNLTGLRWREDAYVSTTARKQTAKRFTGDHGQAPVQMRILVPRGTPAVEASRMDLEAEVLLGRGRELKVVADHGVDPKGVRHVDVEVVR